jgi:hypothetical protein
MVRISPYSTLTSVQIREEVRKAWLGVFRPAACGIMWSEGNDWNIDAAVLYEDGTRTSILMEGFHVELQDQLGNNGLFGFGPPRK